MNWCGKKIVNANSMPCPVKPYRILTVIIYEDGTIEKKCNRGIFDDCSEFDYFCPKHV